MWSSEHNALVKTWLLRKCCNQTNKGRTTNYAILIKIKLGMLFHRQKECYANFGEETCMVAIVTVSSYRIPVTS